MDTVYDTIGSGWTVYTADVRKVGTVSEVNTREGYLVVQKGWIFPRDLFVPLEVIAAIGEGTVRLIYDREQVEAEDWTDPPAERQIETDNWSVPPVQSNDGGTDVHDEPTVVIIAPAPTVQSAQDEDIAGDVIAGDVTEHEQEDVIADEASTFPPFAGPVPEPQTLDINGHSVHTDVIEELETVEVAVRHEELQVEHVPADGAYVAGDAFREVDIEIPLMGERLLVAKRTRVVEVVRILKRSVTEVQQVTDTVRRERLHDEH